LDFFRLTLLPTNSIHEYIPLQSCNNIDWHFLLFLRMWAIVLSNICHHAISYLLWYVSQDTWYLVIMLCDTIAPQLFYRHLKISWRSEPIGKLGASISFFTLPRDKSRRVDEERHTTGFVHTHRALLRDNRASSLYSRYSPRLHTLFSCQAKSKTQRPSQSKNHVSSVIHINMPFP